MKMDSLDKLKTGPVFQSVPVPTGPYQAGTAKYDLVDSYRKDLKFPEGRLIPIQIYFPMERGEHVAYPKIFEERASLGPFKPLNAKGYSHSADISLLTGTNHPIIFLNHASSVAMTDYASIAEDLSSHGYVVVSIQHDLQMDEEAPPFWDGRSCSRHAKAIDNILYVFEWLKLQQKTLFKEKVNLKRIGFIGHSFGGNSLLLWINRTANTFQQDTHPALLFREDKQDVKECLILIETTRFSFPLNNRYPLFFLLAEERESYQRETGCYEQMIKAGHRVCYYKGSTHTSFMDHCYINPLIPPGINEPYFNGTSAERTAFFNKLRRDILEFLNDNLTSFI
jgi:hypothetical protein